MWYDPEWAGRGSVVRKEFMRSVRLLLKVAFILTFASALIAGAEPAQPQEGIRAERNVKYGDAPGKANLLDIYLPAKAEGALPTIAWIHGGGWEAGDKE